MSMTYTAARCAMIFGQTMIPCPACGGFNIGWQTPIKMAEPITDADDAASIIRKYAHSVKYGATPLEGPVFLWCRDCHHKGPSMDCSGRTSEDVGQDRAVATEVKRLWNSQTLQNANYPPAREDGTYFMRFSPDEHWLMVSVKNGKVYGRWIVGGGGNRTPEQYHDVQWSRRYGDSEPEVCDAATDSIGAARNFAHKIKPIGV